MTDSPPVRVVLDTDTDNEIDDQFAVAWALRSPERLALEACYATPYSNERSTGPEDGMLRSYDELRRVVELTGGWDGPVLHGSRAYLPDQRTPVESPAAADLVTRANTGATPLHVVAIGAATNVASALLLDPAIRDRVVVVWLGGQPVTAATTGDEFNLAGDPAAARVLLDSGVPLVRIPCADVAEHVRTTRAELERYARGTGAIGDYLADIYAAAEPDTAGRSRTIWDLAAVAWLVRSDAVQTVRRPSPVLTGDLGWRLDPDRHEVTEAVRVDRDAVFADLFGKLRAA